MKDYSGLILVDKPAGWTSFDVVAKVRGQVKAAYRQSDQKPTKKQQKVGHAGTLDPFATGLLIVLIGSATRQSDQFLKLDKCYEATIYLGQTSSTGDIEGELTQVSDNQPTKEQVIDALGQFTGEITQTPPAYSAIKINGQRAYKLARRGDQVEMPSRQVTIYNIELIDYNYPYLQIRTWVSSGTYIRSLAEDIGNTLNTGAYCQVLKRTAIGDYNLDSAIAPDQAGDNLPIALS